MINFENYKRMIPQSYDKYTVTNEGDKRVLFEREVKKCSQMKLQGDIPT